MKLNSLIRYSLVFVLIALVLATPSMPTQAVSGSDFKAGRIIDDAVFINDNSMTVNQIQSFLNSKVPVCDTNGDKYINGVRRRDYSSSNPAPFTCLKEYYENPTTGANNYGGKSIPSGAKSAAQIILDAGRAHDINPQVLIVTLHKEQSLVTDDWPWEGQYKKAMGYGCPDTGPNNSANCNAEYYGFANQMNRAAAQFRRYLDYPNNYNYGLGSRHVLWHPDSSRCGGRSVNILTSSTAALYNYTPYQPNSAALNNYPGTGDSCSSYGNRNFWFIFNNWFGSTVGSSIYDAESYGSATTSIQIERGGQVEVTLRAKNIGAYTWYDNSSINYAPEGLNPVFIGTDKPFLRSSRFGNGWNAFRNVPVRTFSNSYKISSGSLVQNSDSHVVKPGEVGEWKLTLSANSDISSGTYSEYFKPLASGVGGGGFESTNHKISLTVPKVDYEAKLISKNLYNISTVPESTNAYTVRLKNIGLNTWYDADSISGAPSGSGQVLLVTDKPFLRSSEFGSQWNSSRNTPTRDFNKVYESNNTSLASNQDTVLPGQIAEYRLILSTTNTISPGKYIEHFKPSVYGMAGGGFPSLNTEEVTINVLPSYSSEVHKRCCHAVALPGDTVPAEMWFKNTGNTLWHDKASAISNNEKEVMLYTSRPLPNQSILGEEWTANILAGREFSAVYEADGTTLASNQHIVKPGQIARYNFNFVVPEDTEPGDYVTWMQPAVPGEWKLFNDPGSWLKVEVVRPSYSSEVHKRCCHAVALPGDTVPAEMWFKNTGNTLWHDKASAISNNEKEVMLYTSRPLPNQSILGEEWTANILAGREFSAVYEADGTTLASNQHIVKPGQIARYNFNFVVPEDTEPGDYVTWMQPAVPGEWKLFNDPGSWLKVEVEQ